MLIWILIILYIPITYGQPYLNIGILVVEVKIVAFIWICTQVEQKFGVLAHESHELDLKGQNHSLTYIQCIHTVHTIHTVNSSHPYLWATIGAHVVVVIERSVEIVPNRLRIVRVHVSQLVLQSKEGHTYKWKGDKNEYSSLAWILLATYPLPLLPPSLRPLCHYHKFKYYYYYYYYYHHHHYYYYHTTITVH